MLALGVTKEKMRDLFGGNYLPKLEQMLLEDKSKTIEHEIKWLTISFLIPQKF